MLTILVPRTSIRGEGPKRVIEARRLNLPSAYIKHNKNKFTCLPVHSATGFMMAGRGISTCSPASPRYVTTRQNVWGDPQYVGARR